MPDRCGIVVYSGADYWEDASCEIDESGALFAAAAAAALGGGADTTDDSVRLITRNDDSASVAQHPSARRHSVQRGRDAARGRHLQGRPAGPQPRHGTPVHLHQHVPVVHPAAGSRSAR